MDIEYGELCLNQLLLQMHNKSTAINLKLEGNLIAVTYADSPILKYIGGLYVKNWFVANDTANGVVYIELWNI